MANEFKFQPSPIADAVQEKLVIKRLPEWMQNLEQIQMFCDDVIQQWFNPADQEIVDGYIGDRGSPAAAGKIFLHEADEQRQDYQFSPAYVSRNPDQSVRSMQFYPDLVGYLGHYGALTDNQSRLLSGKFYSWTPPINPNKMQNYSSYLWDMNNEFGIDADYVVMERGAENGNLWSLQNYWYTIGQTLPDGTVLTEQMAQDSSRWKRAQAPIIEFNKDIEMLNYGTTFRGVVDYLSDTVKPEDIVQKSTSANIRIDGYVLKAGDRVLFTSLGNPGENNRIYKIYVKQMDDGSRVYGVTLDEDEQNPSRITGEPHRGDNILIRSGNQYGNKMVHWTGSSWALTQVKSGTNTFPEFQLYDKRGVKLNDATLYPSSDFKGSPLFGLKINFNYGLDKVYGEHVELSSYNYPVFENFLQSTRYSYVKSGTRQEIPGIYYYNVIQGGEMHLHSDWVRSEEESKQFVRQVPSMDKTSMYRIFETVYEMNSFQYPLENMYAYVIADDQNYQYYQASNSTFMAWHKTSKDAIQTDVYNHSFELAQKVNLADSSNKLIVVLDGEELRDYSTVQNSNGLVDHIVIDSSVDLNENSILEIKTYSPTEVPNFNLGSYEIPINLQNNPYNEFIDYINQGDYTPHFTDIIAKNITEGSVNDLNNYEVRLEKGLVDNSVGTKIIQNETSLLPLMLHSANEQIDIFAAIIFVQNEYFRFINKFNRQLASYYEDNRDDFNNHSASEIVDILLGKINVGKDSSFPFYLDGMGSSPSVQRAFIPPTPAFLGITKVHRPEKATYVYAGKDLSCYNIDHMGNLSKAYLVLNGVSKMDDVVFELENRIFNSLDNAFKGVDYQPAMDEDLLKPTPYHTDTEYSMKEYTSLSLRGYVNFIATNGISNSTHDYIQSDWMTWNYTGTTYVVDGQPTDLPARGSWRAIYMDMFGTYKPATHPWEMFGFAQRPDWFNQEYEPTKVRLGEDPSEYIYVYEAMVKNQQGVMVPSGLWDTAGAQGDASQGIILAGARKGQYDRYKRFGTQPFTLTGTGTMTSDGEEIMTYELIEPTKLGLVSGSLDHLAEPWSYGDMGDMEFTYMNTVMYSFDRVMALLRAKPGQFANYFYNTIQSVVQHVVTDGDQFLYGDTNMRLDFNSKTLVHTEDGVRILGYQTWVSDYLIYQNKNVTKNYGDILRSSHINVGHRMGGFTKEDEVSFRSDIFGKISTENQHLGLVRSSAYREEVLSAVKIQWTGTGFAVSGYDLVGATFKFKLPNKRGRRSSINIGRRSVIHYNDYLEQYGEIEYGTLFKTYQEVYTFLTGYGEYLTDIGWIFEDQNENGETQNWDVIGKDFVEWSATNPTVGEFISVSPSTKNAKFGSVFGSVLSVTQFSGGVWSLLDDQNMGIRPFEINTSRIGNVFTVRVEDDVEKRMALIRVSLVAFEHAFVFDDTTIFGNHIYIPKYGSVQEMLHMYGYVTGHWNGRLEAKGFIILEKGTLPSFEKLVDDFRNYYDVDTPVDNTTIRNLAQHLIGFQSREYLTQMISNETSRIEFYQGFIRDKGTNQVLDKVLRVSKTYNTDNYKALQEWAFKIGEYGDVYGKKHLQFLLNNKEMQQQPQMFTFDVNATSDTDESNIVFYGAQGDDPRWLDRPEGKFAFPMRSGRSTRIDLPNIGPVNLTEVSYSTLDFETAYADRIGYTNKTGFVPESVWMFRDQQQVWNIFDLVNTGTKLLSIEPIIGDDDDDLPGTYCKLTFDAPINMEDGDYFYLVDETEFMPDALRVESMYYENGASANEMIVALDIKNVYNFTFDEPVLMRYTSRFATEEEKEAYVAKKYSFDAPESTLFIRPSVFDIRTNLAELYINQFDPINGVIPGNIVQDVSFTTPVDPAKYNNDGESILAWGAERVGQVWWNTTKSFFVDYTRPVLDEDGNVLYDETMDYKRNNWGKLLPHSEVEILEWVASPVLPHEWEKYCANQTKLNKDSTVWIPSGTTDAVNYSTFSEYDSNTQMYNTTYYFWVKNTIYVPATAHRTKPCFEIARMIANPLLLNTPWFSPISENSFIISGMQHDITDDKSVLSITYQDDATDVVKHEQYQLCQEGMDYNFNPIIWDLMWDSLMSQQELPNGKVVNLQYPSNELGLGPNKTMFKDPIEARRTFVDSANDIYKTLNMTTNQVVMDDIFNVKTTETNPNMVTFRVLSYNNKLVISPAEDKFVENDAVLVSSTGTLPEPLTSTNVYFVHFDSDGYIQLMNSPSTGGTTVTINLLDRGEGQLGMIKQSDYIDSLGTSLDMTQYWNLADWYSNGYSEFTIYTEETSIDDANQKNYQEGDVIRITDSDGIWTLYVKKLSRNVVIWEAVGREKSTIALNNQLYYGYEQYTNTGELTNVEKNVRNALSLLKGSFNFYQSRLVFDMVKYVHTEQPVVDWVFKTSYIYIVGLDQSLQRSYITNDNLINQIVDYFEEVKPYRTKIRSQIEQKTSDEDEILGLMNDLDPNGYILVDGVWTKTQKDIWDYEAAVFNTTTNRWEVQGSLPSDFVYPNRRFQEQYDILHFDNVQCTPSSDLYPVETLEAVNKKFQTNENDRITDSTAYKLRRYSYSYPEVDTESIDDQIMTYVSEQFPTMNLDLPLSESVADLYKQFENSIADSNRLNDVLTSAEAKANAGNSSYRELVQYVQYNTLANRVRLYTSKTNDQISVDVGCPFKGKILSDNPNTRLPFGYGASNGANFGYVMNSKYVYDKYVKMVKEAHPSYDIVKINETLQQEYGLYPWRYDIAEEGRFYMDALYVLTGMRNTYNPENQDVYEIARSILKNPTLDSYCMVMVPRKDVYLKDLVKNTTVSIPSDIGIAEYMESEYNNNGVMLELADINLDDIPLDKNSPIYNDFKEVLDSVSGAKYFDDMNAFDNFGLESQTKQILNYVDGTATTTTDPVFIDISDINPSGNQVSQLRFTAVGYGNDTAGQAQVRNLGNFQIEGKVILNPYNYKEVMVSIPRYEDAVKYMDRTLLVRDEIQYVYHVTDVLTTAGEIKLKGNNDFKVGEKVAVFTPEASDLAVLLKDKTTWDTILKVDNIKDGNRPKLFTVTAVSATSITVGGLTFEKTYNNDDTALAQPVPPLGLSVVRVTSFADAEFVKAGAPLYTGNRSYRVNVLDYDLFYDRELIGGSYEDSIQADDYDVWYCTNETGTTADGDEVDHGYKMPIYGKGVLSELVRTTMDDSLQIFVYEYDASVIKPVKSGNNWTYTGTMVDGVYIDGPAKLTVLFKAQAEGVEYAATPIAVNQYTILNGTINEVDGQTVSVDAELIGVRNGYMVRAEHYTAERDYKNGQSYSKYGIDLGVQKNMETYANNYPVIPLSKYAKGLVVSGSDIGHLIK